MKYNKISKFYFERDHKNKFQMMDKLYSMIGKFKTLCTPSLRYFPSDLAHVKFTIVIVVLFMMD